MPVPPISLASYPRSGNTLLRTILNHCFGLKSASIYTNDLGGNEKLETYVGHIEHDEKGKISFPDGVLPLIKTHQLRKNEKRAIYVVRDGRASCVSFWEFYNRSLPLEKVITGHHPFGTWSNHVSSWYPWARPDTLFLKYEDMLSDLPKVLNDVSEFIGSDIISTNIPKREDIAGSDGRWVRKKSDWREHMTNQHIKIFNQTNGQMMDKLGYHLV